MPHNTCNPDIYLRNGDVAVAAKLIQCSAKKNSYPCNFPYNPTNPNHPELIAKVIT